MPPPSPANVKEYLAALPAAVRTEIKAVRAVIVANLDAGYEEGMQYGMIGYYVPHRIYPAGYHCDPRHPLPFALLAAKKNHLTLYLMPLYGDTETARWFEAEVAKTGRKLDRGKSCIRFRRAEDLPLDLIGRTIARLPAKAYVAACEAALAKRVPARRKSAAKG